jgi:hypothetical protein
MSEASLSSPTEAMALRSSSALVPLVPRRKMPTCRQSLVLVDVAAVDVILVDVIHIDVSRC